MMWGHLVILLLVLQQGLVGVASADCPPDTSDPLSKDAVAAARLPLYDPNVVSSELGKLGFKCSYDNDPKTHLGMTCKAGRGVVPGYSEEFAIVIPASYVPGEQPDLFMHLHGNHPPGQTLDSFLNTHGFDKMMAADNVRSSIMLLPYSHGTDVASNHLDLKDPVKYRKMMDALTGAMLRSGLATKSAEPSRIAISAHSGAYDAVGRILQFPCNDPGQTCYTQRIKEVALLDATYGGHEKVFGKFGYNAHFEGHKKMKFVTVSCKGGETVNGAHAVRKEINRYSDNPYGDSVEAETDDDDLSGPTGAHVVFSKTDHFHVVESYLPRLLQKPPVVAENSN